MAARGGLARWPDVTALGIGADGPAENVAGRWSALRWRDEMNHRLLTDLQKRPALGFGPKSQLSRTATGPLHDDLR